MGISTKTAPRRSLFATMATVAIVALVTGLLSFVTGVVGAAAESTPNVTAMSANRSSESNFPVPQGWDGQLNGVKYRITSDGYVDFWTVLPDGVASVIWGSEGDLTGVAVDVAFYDEAPQRVKIKRCGVKVSLMIVGHEPRDDRTLPAWSCKGSTSTSSTKARGDLAKKSCTKVRVVRDTRKVARGTTKYRVLQNKGKKVKKSYSVKAGVRKTSTLKVKKSQKVTLTLQVKNPAGKWVKLDRVKVPRCR